MSEYSELIKRFDKIRDYMRDFYVYGFKSREEFDKKSLRSYDNEKRRIESYLGDYMSFRQDKSEKNVFISVDSSTISENPLYRAFKAKSFTKNDITLHFLILDILQDGKKRSVQELMNCIATEYASSFEKPFSLDISTVRNKLTEYVNNGILLAKKEGNKHYYTWNATNVNLADLYDALHFFSEISPLGVVGSYLLDKYDCRQKILSFKHHYIMHALESEIVYELVSAIHEQKIVQIEYCCSKTKTTLSVDIIPIKILISVQGGRRYLSAFRTKNKAFMNYRLDCIQSVKVLDKFIGFDAYSRKAESILNKTWGVTIGNESQIHFVKMMLHIPLNERFVVNRILREGRNGKLTQIDKTTWKYEIKVYNPMEMLPWIRTFIGRILSLQSSDKRLVNLFYKDFDKMAEQYESDGEEFAVF